MPARNQTDVNNLDHVHRTVFTKSVLLVLMVKLNIKINSTWKGDGENDPLNGELISLCCKREEHIAPAFILPPGSKMSLYRGCPQKCWSQNRAQLEL